jgi:hypothetical protein
MAADYTLLLFNSIKQGRGFQADLTTLAKSWERSIRLQGGYWQGSFDIEGEVSVLQDWFYNRLGWHVEERSHGATTWEGAVYELELTINGVRRRRSLDDMSNFIAVTDKYPGKWEEDNINWPSAVRYGRKENFVAAAPTVYLREHAWPWPRATMINPTGGKSQGKATLNVALCGYAYMLNWVYVNCLTYSGRVDQIHIDTWITELLNNSAREWHTIGRIWTNVKGINKYLQSAIRLWDFLQELTQLGDDAANMFRMYVGNGRKIFYEKIDLTPRYWLRDGDIYTTLGERAATLGRTVQPCVVRDAQYPAYRGEPGSMLLDARDILVEEVHVDGDGRLSLRTSTTSDADILESQSRRRSEDDQRNKDYWREAWDKDYDRRKKEWDSANPGVPWPEA